MKINLNKAHNENEQLDITKVRERVKNDRNKQTWRSLEELADTATFQEFLQEEFPNQSSLALTINSISRREFLKLMGASLVLAGLNACVAQPNEQILPYVEAPQGLIPGEPLHYATAMEMNGYALGLIVKSREGRPIKVEGNPKHPASLGATDVFAQASTLDLYDPDRTQVITHKGEIQTWDNFLAVFTQAVSDLGAKGGAGLHILSGSTSSPTMLSQMKAVQDKFPQAQWHQYDPIGRASERSGAQLAFGQIVETQYHFDQAKIILSLDDDFTMMEPGSVRYAHDFMARRQILEGQTEMNRLYVVESGFTTTGAIADHRLPLQASMVGVFALALAKSLGIQLPGTVDIQGLNLPPGWMDALVSDLQANPGSSLVLVGSQQPPYVHALGHAINNSLGNSGKTVSYTDPVVPQPDDQAASLQALIQALDAGQVDLLLVLEGNPVFSTPADVNFAVHFVKARLRIYLSLRDDETSALADWHIPATHFMETWSDTRAYDGTATIVQPMIAPLYNGRSSLEIINAMLGQPGTSAYDTVRQYWQQQAGSLNFEDFWQLSLHDGVVPNSAFPQKRVALTVDFSTLVPSQQPENNNSSLEIIFLPDPSIWDGRFANNAWLQELPKPLTKLTWDNAALVSMATAQKFNLSDDQVIDLQYKGRVLRVAVRILPGQPDNSVILYLGYGQSMGGQLASGKGFNAYSIRTSDAPWFSNGLEIRTTGDYYPLAVTQGHQTIEGRDLARDGLIEEFRNNPNLFNEISPPESPPPSLYPQYSYNGDAWGMAVNINTCIGCNACVIACQAENNIPVVGKDQVIRGREMHWLRVDTYFKENLDHPNVNFQPIPCMHCEKAPCEPVCPVEATVHDSEGLNEMVYNRCVGTRYCSNNCPYKVRRFNFYQFTDENTIPLKLLRNPEVTTRGRGVMEKCTYCIQRIQNGRIQAEIEGRPIQDGEIIPACAQACPTQAIVFGNINDPASEVRKLKDQPQNYALLGELGTQPRTTYLAKFRNPNPMIKDQAS